MATAARSASCTISTSPGSPPGCAGLPDRLAEAGAAAAVALGVGLVAARRGERGAGPVGVTGGILGTGIVAAFAYRWPTVLPTFASGPLHDRWWILVAAGVAVAIRTGRDPGRR